MSLTLKDELWTYWRTGSDEEEIEDEEGELLRIEANLFDYETPLCKEFSEFNYLLKTDTDVLTGDLPGFKTFETFKDTWLYEWNNQIPWVHDKPMFYDELEHCCEPVRFKNGTCEWPSCDWWNEGVCNGGEFIGMKHNGNNVSFADYSWYDMVQDCERKSKALQEKSRVEGLKELRNHKEMRFLDWVHKSFKDYTKLDRRLQWKLQKEWDKLQGDYSSSSEESYHPLEDDWGNLPESNKEKDEELTDELEDYLVNNQDRSFINLEAELFNQRKCQLLGIPYQKPQTFTAEKFDVVKYSL